MIRRCTQPNSHGYEDYGGRGIAVCERWSTSFENFLADMGTAPSKYHSIERIDFDGNYEPNNCKWATKHEQVRNTRRNKFVVLNGIRMCISDAARVGGIPASTLRYRLKTGMTIEGAIRPLG